ncbi:MAG: hypothetical protein ACRENK_01240 [Gemmatimonadaceae bacterium]
MSALETLLAGIVDYAGLFPPASQDMRSALESYATYLESADRQAIARFIVPVARLSELEATGKDLLPRGSTSNPWKLSVLVTGDIRSGVEEMLRFNSNHSSGSAHGHAQIDVVELKAVVASGIEEQRSVVPGSFTPYFEIPINGSVSALTGTIARVGARAKIRTGGVTADAFPTATQILDFMVSCSRESVAFKATAGLHHPLRGSYALTYAPRSPRGMMYGFVNVFLAAALVYAGATRQAALSVLEETDPAAFTFAGDAIAWRDVIIDTAKIRASRAEFAISFGSCSFREPVDELAELAAASISKKT